GDLEGAERPDSIAAALGIATSSLQPPASSLSGFARAKTEEQEAVPARAGDLAGDGREARVVAALVLEAVLEHADLVDDAVVLAVDHGAHRRRASSRWRREAADWRLQAGGGAAFRLLALLSFMSLLLLKSPASSLKPAEAYTLPFVAPASGFSKRKQPLETRLTGSP